MNEIDGLDKITIKFTFKDGRTERVVIKNPDVVLSAIDYAVPGYARYDGLGYMGHYEPDEDVNHKAFA